MGHPMENTGDVLLQHGESKTDRQNLFIRNQIGWMTAIVILFCFWLFGIDSTYGFSIFPDEFAYWSYAAQAAGYDWSDIMSLSSYFSYGYGYVLFPVFVLCKDAVTAYRVAVGLNFVFLFIGYLALTGTVKRMLTDRNIPVALFCALAVIAPWNLFYTQMTMTEVFLASLYMVTGRILLCYLENNRLSALVLCVFALMFLYIVHMRAIGIVLSGLIVLSVHICLCRKEKWHLLVAASLVVLLFVIAGFAKEQAFLGVYGGRNREFLTGSDYGGQIEKIQYIFTKDGFYDLLVSILGKILYLGLATYGLFYWGSFALGKQSVKLYRRIRSRVEATMQEKFSLFILLSVLAQVMVSAVYLLTLGEVDDYTYGRYNEFVIPFVMVLGLYVLWRERAKTVFIVTGGFAVLQLAMTFLVVKQITYTGVDIFFGYFMVGISYLYDGGVFAAGSFYARNYLFCELLTVCVTGIVLFGRSVPKRMYIVLMLAVMEFALAVHADNLYLEPFKKAAFRDSRIADRVNDMWEEGRRVIYMDYGFPSYIGILQFMARDVDIQIMERKESVEDYQDAIREDDLVIFAFDDESVQEWSAKYDYVDTYGHFTVLYN